MTWVDFKALRAQIGIAAVLKHYGVELKSKKGDQHQGFCPLPTHQGQKRSPSFSVNLARGIWQCFGCGAKGNTLDLACRLDGLNPADGQDIRTTALKLRERFGLESSNANQRDGPKRRARNREPRSGQMHEGTLDKTAERVAARPAVVNAPLDFALKNLESNHRYLKARGVTTETVAFFGLGYCGRGAFQGRIVIPLHDPKGQLVGYAGRVVDDSQISEQNPKYKFPPSRLRHDEVHEFRKSLILYNLHRLAVPVTDLIVVEGFASTWWNHQHGYDNVVAVMGNSCSPEQAALIVRAVASQGRVWAFTDGDEGGDRCATSIFTHVAPERCVRWIKLRKAEQPTDCTADELSAMLPSPSSEGGIHGSA